jgi:NADH dehydrogenase FAD-containing subunit
MTNALLPMLSVQIDLKSLANWAETEFICGKVVGMSLSSPNEGSMANQKLIHVEVQDKNRNNTTIRYIPFDVVSIDIGSTTRDFTTVPGANRYCISTRPISDLVRRIEIEEARLKEELSR